MTRLERLHLLREDNEIELLAFKARLKEHGAKALTEAYSVASHRKKIIEKMIREESPNTPTERSVIPREKSLATAAGDVCATCGKRATGAPLSGPNEAGNFVHGIGYLCPASAIWARIRYEYPDSKLLPTTNYDH